MLYDLEVAGFFELGLHFELHDGLGEVVGEGGGVEGVVVGVGGGLVFFEEIEKRHCYYV